VVPHLEKIKDPGELELGLDRLRAHYNTIRLHEGIARSRSVVTGRYL